MSSGRFQPVRRALLRAFPAAGLLASGVRAATGELQAGGTRATNASMPPGGAAPLGPDGSTPGDGPSGSTSATPDAGRPAGAVTDPWARATAIATRCAAPLRFRDEDFLLTFFGAKPCAMVTATGQTASQIKGALRTPAPNSPDCRPALTAAIAACHAKGGGRVVIPAGDWYCAGPLVLRSHVHVHLAAGARLHFSANPEHYCRDGAHDCGANGKLTRSRWQGNDCLNYSPLIYALNETNIALTGADWTSVLDGQGGVPFEGGTECWWDWKGRGNPASLRTEVAPNPANAALDRAAPDLDATTRAHITGIGPRWQTDARYLPALSEAGVPLERRIFGRGHFLRPPMVQLIGCTRVLLQGYQIEGAPFWVHHPVGCRDVCIRGVNMQSLGPNSDGFDPEACTGVLVEDCTFNTGDDCIAIKSGKNLDTALGPSRDIVIRRCVMNSGHGAVTLGSEMAAGIEHVYAEQLEFRNLHWRDDPLGTAIRLKTNMNRGGYLRHLYVRDIAIPNGVQTRPGFSRPLATSGMAPVATNGGAIITIDCDYMPGDDPVRTRPPVVSDIDIRRIRAGNVDAGDGRYSCYQVLVLQGPAAASFNGPPGTPIPPVARVRIEDCDFGTPRLASEPWVIRHAENVVFANVTIAGRRHDTTLSK